MANIFGTKVSVCSWMEVTVWKILTIRPTHKDTNNSGAEHLMITYKALLTIALTSSIVI